MEYFIKKCEELSQKVREANNMAHVVINQSFTLYQYEKIQSINFTLSIWESGTNLDGRYCKLTIATMEEVEEKVNEYIESIVSQN